ncbi:MAG: hypothetical protein FWE12_00135 [Oscillospiraceae bacterium]|nr:hypothetical protein [Oscillospiraceae bacterium]
MDWSAVGQIVLTSIVSSGVVGAILVFAGNRKLERLKSQLERKNYVSKARFDLEIEVYRELSEAMLQMVFENSNLFPPDLTFPPADEAERREYYTIQYQEATSRFNQANQTLLRNAPFMPEDIYQMFRNIKNLCGQQLSNYRLYGPLAMENRRYSEIKANECFDKTRQIDQDMTALMNHLRTHIASLDTLDQT